MSQVDHHKESKDGSVKNYNIRPEFKDMFNPRKAQEIIQEVLKQHLTGKKYDQNETGNWTKDIATAVKNRLKDGLHAPRYKIVTQVIIGEMKGAGVRMGCRCLWDGQTDKLAQETFTNVSPCPKLDHFY